LESFFKKKIEGKPYIQREEREPIVVCMYLNVMIVVLSRSVLRYIGE
jgi:hypothetical protein